MVEKSTKMDTNENAATVLGKCLANAPESFNIPQDVDREILSEFVDSTASGLEQLEGVLLAFDYGRITQGECITIIRRILHNIKGEAGIMDFGTISSLCHHAESLLYEDFETIPCETLFLVKDWLTKAMQYIRKTNAKLSEHIFETQLIKILDSAQIDLFDLGYGTTDTQAVQLLLGRMAQIAELAADKSQPQIKALAEKALNLLGGIQQNPQCVISDVHKESLFDLLVAIKQSSEINPPSGTNQVEGLNSTFSTE